MPASSRIRDDYTLVAPSTKAKPMVRRWPWLVCGFVAPIVALPLIMREPAQAADSNEAVSAVESVDEISGDDASPVDSAPVNNAPVYTKVAISDLRANRPISNTQARPNEKDTADLYEIARAAAGRAVEEVTEKIEIEVATPPAEAATESKTAVPAPEIVVAEPAPVEIAEKAAEQAINQEWIEIKVRPGDALSTMIEANGMATQDWLALSKLKGKARVLTRMRAGQTFRALRRDGRLQALSYNLDEFSRLEVTRNDSGIFEYEVAKDEIDRRNAHAVGNITSSLFLAGRDAGLSDRLIMEMANIFGWDIDFALDMRIGDRFVAVYEELYKDGEKVRNGDIVAAEFVNDGRAYRAVRYTDEGGYSSYYTPDGAAMRKAFLRTPVALGRISSGFSLRRKHPVLNRFRAHKGVDYAAATGTPIRVTGDGKIIHRGTKGGYGRTVIVRHGNGATTLYAHMSRYKGGMGVGSRVRQGQTIGYVGASGLATGPHLHYEFRMNGVHKNPLRIKAPRAKPIPKNQRKHFDQQVAPLVAQLDSIATVELAMQ